MLTIDHVTKTYGKFTALRDITLELESGVYGLLAPNGAGKTTLLKLITTLLFPTSGQILWDGKDIIGMGEEYRALLGYLPQEFGYYPSYKPQQFLNYVATSLFGDLKMWTAYLYSLLQPVCIWMGQPVWFTEGGFNAPCIWFEVKGLFGSVVIFTIMLLFAFRYMRRRDVV